MKEARTFSANDIKLFSNPLIIGASISAGYGTRDGGPGSVLARMINPKTKITNFAFNGATSVQSTARLDLSTVHPSIVLGFDLFFWDAVRGQVGSAFEAHTRKLFKAFQDRGIPLIIGKLPILDFPLGPQVETIKRNALKVNTLLEELCTLDKNSLLYDPLTCLLSMNSEDHFSDNLHLSKAGNEFCAKFLADSGVYRNLKCGPELEVA